MAYIINKTVAELKTITKQTYLEVEIAPGVIVTRKTVKEDYILGSNPDRFNLNGIKKTNTFEYIKADTPKSIKNSDSAIITLLFPGVKEKIQCEGWQAIYEDPSKKIITVDTKPYKSIVENEADISNLVWANSYDHSLYDINGLDLPVAVHCSYMNGHYDNSHYNLPKLVKHLEKRKDIVFQEDNQARSYDKLGNHIYSVPHYNNDGGETCVYFIWVPSVKDYREVKSHMNDKTYDIHSVIFDLDIFGLRKAGIAYGKTYYDTKKD